MPKGLFFIPLLKQTLSTSACNSCHGNSTGTLYANYNLAKAHLKLTKEPSLVFLWPWHSV